MTVPKCTSPSFPGILIGLFLSGILGSYTMPMWWLRRAKEIQQIKVSNANETLDQCITSANFTLLWFSTRARHGREKKDSRTTGI